jgi:hypothetical protein
MCDLDFFLIVLNGLLLNSSSEQLKNIKRVFFIWIPSYLFVDKALWSGCIDEAFLTLGQGWTKHSKATKVAGTFTIIKKKNIKKRTILGAF